METNSRNALLSPVIGRLASIVTRYLDKAKFDEAVERVRLITAEPSINPVGPDAKGRIIYSAPVAEDNAQIEIRLIYKDLESERGSKPRKKAKTSRYYQVAGRDAAALGAKAQEIIAFYSSLGITLNYLDGIEQDEAAVPLRDPTQRVILADDTGETQICMLVNPPFPRTKSEGFLQKLPALLAVAAGVGALLLGTFSLLRRR